MNAGKTDIWMPVYIGDYLADTMHLSTEQHGAYLLLLFHLWRRGMVPDDDAALAQISGLGVTAWSISRAVLAEFFEIHDGLWHHGRVERERCRIAAKQQSNSNKAKVAAHRRWGNGGRLPVASPEAADAQSTCSSDASGNATAIPDDAKSDSDPELLRDFPSSSKTREKRIVDPRHTPFRTILAEYWSYKNHAAPEMPWQGRDAKALSDFLAASPNLSDAQFRLMLRNRAKSAVAHGDRVYLWIGNLTRFQEEITVYNKPASAGEGHASRAEINRNSVVSAVGGAIALARGHADRVGQAGLEQTAFVDAGMPSADGSGSDRCALANPGNGYHWLETGDAAYGQAGANGPFPDGPAATAASGPAAVGGLWERGSMRQLEPKRGWKVSAS